MFEAFLNISSVSLNTDLAISSLLITFDVLLILFFLTRLVLPLKLKRYLGRDDVLLFILMTFFIIPCDIL